MGSGEHTVSFTEQGIPTHRQLVVPIFKAVASLGGSAKRGAPDPPTGSEVNCVTGLRLQHHLDAAVLLLLELLVHRRRLVQRRGVRLEVEHA